MNRLKVELCIGNGQATRVVAAESAILVHMGVDDTAEEAVTATEPQVEDDREVDDKTTTDDTAAEDRPAGARGAGRVSGYLL